MFLVGLGMIEGDGLVFLSNQQADQELFSHFVHKKYCHCWPCLQDRLRFPQTVYCVVPQTIYCGVLSWKKKASRDRLWPRARSMSAMCPPCVCFGRLQILSAMRPPCARHLSTLRPPCVCFGRLQTLSTMCPPHVSALPLFVRSLFALYPLFVGLCPGLFWLWPSCCQLCVRSLVFVWSLSAHLSDLCPLLSAVV